MNNSNITSGGNDILINEDNFPDPCFREWLLEQDFVQNGIIAKEQIAEITEINVSCKKIGSLEGIYFFTALTTLRCDRNKLARLDISKNTALRELRCGDNQLTSLDVTNNMAFDWLECHNNNIKGTNMDALISSLPNTDGKIYIYDSISETEGNVCTETQVAAIREKGWTPYYL